jgi:hypothetical protein
MPHNDDHIFTPAMQDRIRRERKTYGNIPWGGSESVPDVAPPQSYGADILAAGGGGNIYSPSGGTATAANMASGGGGNIDPPSGGTATAAIAPPSDLDLLLGAPTSRHVSARIAAKREFMAERGIKPSEKSKYERALEEESYKRDAQVRRDRAFRAETDEAASKEDLTRGTQFLAAGYTAKRAKDKQAHETAERLEKQKFRLAELAEVWWQTKEETRLTGKNIFDPAVVARNVSIKLAASLAAAEAAGNTREAERRAELLVLWEEHQLLGATTTEKRTSNQFHPDSYEPIGDKVETTTTGFDIMSLADAQELLANQEQRDAITGDPSFTPTEILQAKMTVRYYERRMKSDVEESFNPGSSLLVK